MDYSRFLAERADLIQASPIRMAISRIAELTEKGYKVVSLAAGDPDPDIIPRKLLAEMMQEVLDDSRSVIYAPTQGWPDTKRAIARFYERQYDLNISSEDMIVTTGGEQAIDLVARVLYDSRDIVVLENPSYTNAILCWRPYGPDLIGVPIDDNGMRTDMLEVVLKRLRSEGKRVKLVYTITPGHNPSGVTLKEDRCKHLLEMASTYDFLVFEDAAYLPLQYESGTKSLISIDKEGRVIHESTASKIMGTGWRIGWLVARGAVLEKILQAKMPIDMCAPSFSQLLFERLVTKDHVRGIISTACEAYKQKRDLMVKTLEEYLPDLRFTRPKAGMFLMLWVSTEVEGWDFFDKLLERHHVAVVPGGPFFLDGSGANTLRLNFSRPRSGDIPVAIKSIAAQLKC